MKIAISLPSRLCLALALGLLLESCSIFPASGPTRKDIVESVTPSLTSGEPSFALVEIDGNSLNALARRAPSTFRGYFGDYRPAGSQTIGVDDSIQITVWEAASGGLFSSTVADRMSPGSRSAAIPDQVVGRDGSVTVPYAGRVQVAGRSQQEVESAIIERLRGKAIEPQAVVNVTRNITNTVQARNTSAWANSPSS